MPSRDGTRRAKLTAAHASAVLRARIVLLAAQGWGVAPSARHLQVTVSTVRKWRGRFATSGLDGLLDRQRSGRPCRFDGLARSAQFSLACRPVPEDLYRNHWTADELRRELLAADVVSNISVASVARLLAQADLKPYRFRMWVHRPDPQFREKVAELCALYTRPIGPNQVVLCIDEKTAVWNRCERQPFRWTFTGYPLQTGLTHAKSHRHTVRGQSTGRIARAA